MTDTIVPFGHENTTTLWGITTRERLWRIARAAGMRLADAPVDCAAILADLDYAFDPAWLRWLRTRPGTALVRDGRIVLAHVDGLAQAAAIYDGQVPAGMTIVDAADERGIYDDALRKRERPFAARLEPGSVAALERASYAGAYKGVTDLLTKYLWPTWAFHLTRIAAAIGLSPNAVTAIGTVFCVIATVAFWHGWFWTGLATGLVFMVLDTVDGKLARCTITSSRIGDIWDHGIDLIHPPIWWWAWSVGCAAWGRPLNPTTFWLVIGAMLFGYVAQRLIEGAFIARFKMHIHVWQRFDSRFRLVTARRNPNMVILLAGLLIGRPDLGIIWVAGWTMLSLVVHLVRLVQAISAARRGQAITSWLA